MLERSFHQGSIPNNESMARGPKSYPVLSEVPPEYHGQLSIGPFNIIGEGLKTAYDEYKKNGWEPVIVQNEHDHRYYIYYINQETKH